MEHLNKILGKYKLTRFIGEGGMASVYEGTHEKLGTKVAVKILNPLLASNKQIRLRFENEAKFMASLEHPNITKVLDYDEQPDMLAIIMELLHGQDLSTLIKTNGALAPAQAIPIFSQILDAFQYAHSKGIVHRDIKPSNIFLNADNQVKILDFGIAKIFGSGEDFTSTGTQLGTPVYMSPEQVKSDKSIDHRSDIYSLGITLFYTLNGRPPYDSTTQSNFEIFNKIVSEPIPDLQNFPEFNPVIRQAVAKQRDQRFQSVSSFKIALLSARTGVNNIANDHRDDKTLIESADNIIPVNHKISDTKNPGSTKSKQHHPGRNKIIAVVATVLALLVTVFFVLIKPVQEEERNVLELIKARNPDSPKKVENKAVINQDAVVQNKEPEKKDEITGANNQSRYFIDKRDQHRYNTVKIGNKVWMAENLVFKSTQGFHPENNTKWGDFPDANGRYHDLGTGDGKITSEEYLTIYGGLYTWDAANSSCPEGWHLPSRAEWEDLINYHGGSTVAGRKLSAYFGAYNGYGDWNTLATNDFGFNAVPAGRMAIPNKLLGSVNGYADFWSSTVTSDNEAVVLSLEHSSNGANLKSRDKYYYGLSVRCVKD